MWWEEDDSVGEVSRTREIADIAPPPRTRCRKGTRKAGRFMGGCSIEPSELEENDVVPFPATGSDFFNDAR